MNPLSPFTYAFRHKGLSLVLAAVLALTVMGLYLFIGLAQETYIAPVFTINRYLTKFSLVQPDQVPALDPDIAAGIRAHPDVAHVLSQNDIRIKVANIGGANIPFRLIGLKETDTDAVLKQSGISLKEGRLPRPGTSEVALSEEIVAALRLKIGETFDRTKDEKAYTNIVSPLQLAGVLAGEVRLGIMSYDYLAQSESYRGFVAEGLLVIARPGREAAVEEYLLQSVRSPEIKTYTYRSVSEQVAKDQQLLYVLGIPIVLLVAAAITLVIGAINRLAFTRRLAEFGTLHAMGYRRGGLALRLALETAGPAVVGWITGILLAWGGMAAVSRAVYAPHGFGFESLPMTALPFVTIVPLMVIGSALLTAARALGRMDPVAVVERGQLTLEAEPSGSAARHSAAGHPRPLASWTYYRRHARQGAVLIGATLLLILGTGLLFFIFAAGADAMQPGLNVFSRVSAVSPNKGPLEPSLIERIRENPAVARVIGVYTFSPVKISIPPMFPNQPVETLCVTAGDMAYLVDLYRLELAQGRLPQAGTNEVVISWAVSKNRNIHLGDVIGDPEHPVYSGAPSLPIPIVVSGIFAPAGTLSKETWLSFMSLEYVEPYRQSDLSLIVVPRAGQRAALNDWLEKEISGEGRLVLTHENQRAAFQKEMGSMLFTFSLMECVIALVAALTLAGLHYLFVAGREAELATLHALGFTRRQLTGRILGEMFFTVCAAWSAGLAGCLAVLVFLQYGLLASVGLQLNFFNPAPWLVTLPIPAAVLAAGAGLTAWMLSRLDPISILERRI
jgi:ABC-type lipoprotein release transport system permease subunit